MKRKRASKMSIHEAVPSYGADVFSMEDESAPAIDFSCTRPEIVHTAVEGERLTYNHLFNPAFAAEISLIEPLPHQRIAVYEHMVQQSRLRFLLADNADAGKTIMTGLYIREMLTRRLISHILIVPPAGLVGNWEQELRTLFNLSFTIVGGGDAKTRNPFTDADSDLLIVSIDTLRGDSLFARLRESAAAPYDLVIFDEAHKLSTDREADLSLRKTDRFRLAEALAGIHAEHERWSLSWSCHHLTSAFNSSILERTYGQWPCDYAGAHMVSVGQRTEIGKQPPTWVGENGNSDSTGTLPRDYQPGPNYEPSGVFTAAATLRAEEIQNLVEELKKINDECLKEASTISTFQLHTELRPKPATKPNLEKINELLQDVSSQLKLT